MCKPSQYINDICADCHPRDYIKTLSKFAGESGTYEDYGEIVNEYLYECCGCGEKVWVDEQWVNRNAVTVKSLKQHSEYINREMKQLDKITDAHKYTRRLSHIMKYHKLLTDAEMISVRDILNNRMKARDLK